MRIPKFRGVAGKRGVKRRFTKGEPGVFPLRCLDVVNRVLEICMLTAPQFMSLCVDQVRLYSHTDCHGLWVKQLCLSGLDSNGLRSRVCCPTPHSAGRAYGILTMH